MTDIVVLARSGGGGDLVADTLREMGLSALESTTSSIEPKLARIAVLYPFELFPQVMTDHWARSVLTTPAIWAVYRHHLPCMQKSPELASDVTLDDWARNVDNAMRTIIGKYDLLNGSLEAYQRDVNTYTPTSLLALDTIDLSTVLTQPEQAVEELASIVSITELDNKALTESLSTRVARNQQVCEPWLIAYREYIRLTPL